MPYGDNKEWGNGSRGSTHIGGHQDWVGARDQPRWDGDSVDIARDPRRQNRKKTRQKAEQWRPEHVDGNNEDMLSDRGHYEQGTNSGGYRALCFRWNHVNQSSRSPRTEELGGVFVCIMVSPVSGVRGGASGWMTCLGIERWDYDDKARQRDRTTTGGNGNDRERSGRDLAERTGSFPDWARCGWYKWIKMSSIAVIVVVDRSMNRFYKQSFDDDDAACAVDAGYWTAQAPDLYTGPFQSRTLLQELYDEPTQEIWSQQLQQQQQHFPPRPHEYQISRRNTYPVVRCDRDMQYQPFMTHQYPDQFSQETPLGYHDTSTIKLEDPSSILLPSNQSFYRPQSSAAVPLPMPYTPSLPIQHTDDAASKETQFLRRRCFNCHTTEPPSWRRSTLNPGKIVCNKCGLYERTHLRPRPLRFDELRAGNKHRKASKDTVSPKAKPSNVKKVPPLLRRASVSSNGSVHSAGATSDWDENSMSFNLLYCFFTHHISLCLFFRFCPTHLLQFSQCSVFPPLSWLPVTPAWRCYPPSQYPPLWYCLIVPTTTPPTFSSPSSYF